MLWQFGIGEVEEMIIILMPEFNLLGDIFQILKRIDFGYGYSGGDVYWIHRLNVNSVYKQDRIIVMSSNEANNEGMINCAQQLAKIPFFTRVLYFSLVILWFVNLLTGIPSVIIASSVTYTFSHLYLWTVLTSSFFIDGLFFMTIVIFNFHTFLPKLEQRYSTLVVLVKFVVNGAIITLMTLGVQLLINYEKVQINGVYGVWFNMLYKYCYFNQERQIKFCCFAWKMKKNIYPFVLLAVCAILSFSIPVDMIIGLLYGVLEVRIQRFFCFLSGKGLYNKLSLVLKFDSIKCWIQYNQSREPEQFSDKTLYTNLQNYQMGALGSGDSLDKSTSDPFASKKGVRLGDY